MWVASENWPDPKKLRMVIINQGALFIDRKLPFNKSPVIAYINLTELIGTPLPLLEYLLDFLPLIAYTGKTFSGYNKLRKLELSHVMTETRNDFKWSTSAIPGLTTWLL